MTEGEEPVIQRLAQTSRARQSTISLLVAYASHSAHNTDIRQAPVVRKVDNAIHWINHYPVDSSVCFVNTYPLDSDLSGG